MGLRFCAPVGEVTTKHVGTYNIMTPPRQRVPPDINFDTLATVTLLSAGAKPTQQLAYQLWEAGRSGFKRLIRRCATPTYRFPSRSLKRGSDSTWPQKQVDAGLPFRVVEQVPRTQVVCLIDTVSTNGLLGYC